MFYYDIFNVFYRYLIGGVEDRAHTGPFHLNMGSPPKLKTEIMPMLSVSPEISGDATQHTGLLSHYTVIN